MIRINLLPEAKRVAASSGSSQVWAIIYMLAISAWSVVLLLVYLNFKSALDEQLAANTALTDEISRVKAKSADIGKVEADLAKSRQVEEVVGKLQSARQGPARVLMELSKLLSEGGGPAITPERLEELRKTNPLAGFSAGWDTRRLWLTLFTEDNRRVNIKGFAKSNEDIAEFLRRLALSDLFTKVTLQATTATAESATKVAVVSFDLSCQVKY
jgi:type IV pilus assembly protein PilN